MKIQEHSNKLETNVEAESQNFGIGDASVVIEILRNRLYENKIQTLVQEYICNSRDAMREVGKGNEFEVTVPTRLNPVFKVRDFGPGISPDRMRSVFVMYGSSTKRGTNNQTGGFGIGAKSAWSYTDSFTIVSVTDGTRRTYVAHTGVNNNGRLDLVSTESTDQENGTEIQVAVKSMDIEEFRSAIFRAIYFWSEKPKLKGELSPPTLVRGEVVSDLVEIIDRNLLPDYLRHEYGHQIIAVIDGVPYSIGDKLMEKAKSLTKLTNLITKQAILHFGNGVVEVAASRESIADSPHTIASLEKMGSRASLEVKTYISDAFAKVNSTSEYFKTYLSMNHSFKVDQFAKYGEYSIDNGLVESPLLKKVKMTVIHCMGKYGRGRVEKITKDDLTSDRSKRISIERIPHLFFSNSQESKVVQNKRVREYFKGPITSMILIELLNTSAPTLDATGKPVLDKEGKQVFHPVSYPAEYAQVICELGARDFSSITYVDPPRVAKAKVKREDAEICLHLTYGERHLYTTLATNTQKWIYVPMKEGKWSVEKSWVNSLASYAVEFEKLHLCGMAERAIKMVENDPNFISFKDWMNAFQVSKELILAAKYKASRFSNLVDIFEGVKDIEDTTLTEVIAEYKAIEKTKIHNLPDLLAHKIKENQEVMNFKALDEKFEKLMNNEYSLLKDIDNNAKNKKEITFYVNAKYKLNKGKKNG